MFSIVRLAAFLLLAAGCSAGAQESLGGAAGPRVDENRSTQGGIATTQVPVRQADRTRDSHDNPGTITGGM